MNILERLSKVKTLILDIDGVLTNGQLLIQEDGSLLRSMNVKDGYALQLAVKKGIQVVVISGAQNEPATIRLKGLGIEAVYTGVKDKKKQLGDLVESGEIDLSHSLYMGDDVPDILAMQMCELIACPKDACVDVQLIAHYISPLSGGEGCVRDVIEKVLKSQHLWF